MLVAPGKDCERSYESVKFTSYREERDSTGEEAKKWILLRISELLRVHAYRKRTSSRPSRETKGRVLHLYEFRILSRSSAIVTTLVIRNP